VKIQQWGTFSVKDHLKARPFVAEVLLFDKLVIPRPATEKESSGEGVPAPVEDQMARWRREQWYPDEQRVLLDILGEFGLSLEVPWGGHAQHDWQQLYKKTDSLECDRSDFTQSIQDQVDLAKTEMPEEAAYLATGGVLSLYVANQLGNQIARKLLSRVREQGVPVEPVIAYGSYEAFKMDQGVKEAEDDHMPVEAAPYALFGWEFFVPEDSEKTDAQLLREAAKLACRRDLSESRQYFHGWLKQMYTGEVDREDAKAEMLKVLSEYTKIMRSSGLANAAKYAAKVAQIAAPLAGLVGHTLGVEVGVAVSGVSLAIEKLIPMPQVPDRLRPAALLYDARKFFHKRQS
jgi:hypothetical protein